MIRVAFVCWGNICRSTLSESVFTYKVKELGLKIAFQEVGIMAEKGILDGLNYFSRIGEEELDQIIENGTELWNIRDVAAYMEVSLRTVRRYISEGKLKPEKISKSGEKLFSNLDVMELYREKQMVERHIKNF